MWGWGAGSGAAKWARRLSCTEPSRNGPAQQDEERGCRPCSEWPGRPPQGGRVWGEARKPRGSKDLGTGGPCVSEAGKRTQKSLWVGEAGEGGGRGRSSQCIEQDAGCGRDLGGGHITSSCHSPWSLDPPHPGGMSLSSDPPFSETGPSQNTGPRHATAAAAGSVTSCRWVLAAHGLQTH